MSNTFFGHYPNTFSEAVARSPVNNWVMISLTGVSFEERPFSISNPEDRVFLLERTLMCLVRITFRA